MGQADGRLVCVFELVCSCPRGAASLALQEACASSISPRAMFVVPRRTALSHRAQFGYMDSVGGQTRAPVTSLEMHWWKRQEEGRPFFGHTPLWLSGERSSGLGSH